jgi:hypothetical protein
LLTDEPFSMRLNQSAKSSVLQGEVKPSAASNSSDDEPESTYIPAPKITRAIPTLDAGNASESVLEITATSNSISKDLPEETYIVMPLIAEPTTTTLVKTTKATKLPCQALREQKPKVLRTSVLAGNIDFDNLFVEQWQPSSKNQCSSKQGRNGECRKFFTLHLPLTKASKKRKTKTEKKEEKTNQTQANPTPPAPSSSPPASKKPANTSCSPATASSPPGSAPPAATSPACR